MSSRTWLALTLAAGLGAARGAEAAELVYLPTNPSFGGNPFNAGHLLGIAGANDRFRDPQIAIDKAEREARERSGAEFERIIRSSLLSQISSRIAEQIYGETAREAGSFQIGNTTVDFRRDGGQTVVNIIDVLTGGTTTISIPTPGF
ncbi:MAG TPA: curli assembly protein CsgF [Azospirillaceae bacterium]|nr:curli assembly protein CsgF [Azospirillaceae bacterium]